MLQHGSCAAWNGCGVLLIGPSGSGKSDLLLRLLDRPGWLLVADDQVRLRSMGPDLSATAPESLSGMLEVRGIGVLQGLEAASSASLSLLVDCVNRDEVPRLPLPRTWRCAEGCLPALALYALEPSAPRKVELALLAAGGHLSCRAGAFPRV